MVMVTSRYCPDASGYFFVGLLRHSFECPVQPACRGGCLPRCGTPVAPRRCRTDVIYEIWQRSVASRPNGSDGSRNRIEHDEAEAAEGQPGFQGESCSGCGYELRNLMGSGAVVCHFSAVGLFSIGVSAHRARSRNPQARVPRFLSDDPGGRAVRIRHPGQVPRCQSVGPEGRA